MATRSCSPLPLGSGTTSWATRFASSPWTPSDRDHRPQAPVHPRLRRERHRRCALAFLLDRALEKKLKATRVAMSAAAALTALRTVHVVDFIVGPTRKWGSRAVVPAL